MAKTLVPWLEVITERLWRFSSNSISLGYSGITILIVVLGLVGYRYIKNKQADDVLTIGISPPYAELLQSVANEVEKQGVHVKLVEFLIGEHPMLPYKTAILMQTFPAKRIST